MPLLKSAKKALRQTTRRTSRNRAWKTKLHDAVKKALTEKSKESVSFAYKIADKSAKAGIIKANKAARIKSRLSRLVEAKA